MPTFPKRVTIRPNDFQWRESPSAGVSQMMLDGIGGQHGDYPAESWIRSPHQSGHMPFSKEGCLIYVKTGHLHPDALAA